MADIRANAANWRYVRNFSTSHDLGSFKNRLIIVVLSDEEVISTGSPQGFKLNTVFVASDLRRKRIGSNLAGKLKKVAFERGLRELTVSSSSSR
ncbi:GNAT family N-acetyltransferase [Roseibium sp. RKSG952]|nr:GNAT family N-acetyltransferase [Roseibium sp. RKSG952]